MEVELRRRVVTGVIGGSVLLLLLIFGGRLGSAFVAVVISLGMVNEFIDIVFSLPDKSEKKMVLLGTTWLVAFVNFWIPRSEYVLLLLVFVGIFSYFLFSADRYKLQELGGHFRELMYAMFCILYLTFLPLFLPLIHSSANGTNWTILFLIVVWAGDTAAYFGGKKLGKHRLYALISPKKTLEGAIAGILGGLIVAVLYKLIVFRSLPWSGALIIPVLIGILSQVGDLCESFLKRAFDRKDSGTILPGHGGFLDRFDGVVFSLPIMYGCTRIFG